jgi:hypothetical protein
MNKESCGAKTALGKTVKASDHMDRVASIGCILCHEVFGFYVSAELHHIGDSAERSDFLVIPLCPGCHRGANGFHGLGEREFNRRYRTSEIKLLALVLERLA